MFKGIVAGLALTLMVATACGNSDDNNGSSNTISCDNPKSKCPNDGPLSEELKTLCKTFTSNSKCSNVFINYFVCLQNKQICTDAGITDQVGTNDACMSNYNEASACAASLDGGTTLR